MFRISASFLKGVRSETVFIIVKKYKIFYLCHLRFNGFWRIDVNCFSLVLICFRFFYGFFSFLFLFFFVTNCLQYHDCKGQRINNLLLTYKWYLVTFLVLLIILRVNVQLHFFGIFFWGKILFSLNVNCCGKYES